MTIVAAVLTVILRVSACAQFAELLVGVSGGSGIQQGLRVAGVMCWVRTGIWRSQLPFVLGPYYYCYFLLLC